MILAAIYLLWSYQRMAYGPVHDEHRNLPDVSLREVVVLAPVLALLLVFGVYPKLLTDTIDPATTAVIAARGPARDRPPTSATRSSTFRRRRASSRPSRR